MKPLRRLQGQPIEYLIAVFFSNACVAIAFAIVTPTLVANLTESHTSAFLIALVTSIWALPSVVGGPFFLRLIARYNTQLCLILGVCCYVLIVLALPVFRNVWVWIVLQAISGFILGHFYVVTETWLNLFAKDQLRGRITAIYGIVPAVGYLVGTGIYTLVGFHGYTPFFAAAIVLALGSAPLLFLRGGAGNLVVGAEIRLWATARLVPLLLLIAAMAGMLQTAAWGVFHVYVLNMGFPVRALSWVLLSFFAGQIVLTYVLGWIGDRVDRRRLLTWIGWITTGLMLAMYMWGHTHAVWVILFVCGGAFCAIYTLGLAVLGQRFEARSLASGVASYMTAYSVGAAVGDPLLGAFMDRFGSSNLPLLLAVATVSLGCCALAARSEWRAALNSAGQ